MAAPDIIQQLVTKFTENREAYRSGKYNEAQLRQQFGAAVRARQRVAAAQRSLDFMP